MHPNETLVRDFFQAINDHDLGKLIALYHDKAIFEDIAFRLHGKRQVEAMWTMIFSTSTDGKAADIAARIETVSAEENCGTAFVVENYTFRDTGRSVCSAIESRFDFRDGKIYRHIDKCNAPRWAEQALGGVKSWLFGYSGAIRNHFAMKKIEKCQPNAFAAKNEIFKSAGRLKIISGLLVTCILVLFLWFVSALFVQVPKLDNWSLAWNASAVTVLWIICPVIWMEMESHYWHSTSIWANRSFASRSAWLGSFLIPAFLIWHAVRDTAGLTGIAPSKSSIRWELVVEFSRIIAWPALTAMGFVMFRRPLIELVRTLGNRVSEIGVFSVSLKLGLLPEAKQWSGPRLDDLKAEYPAAASDSSGGLLRAIADTTNADYVVIDLDEGEAWLTSRLFILAALIPRVRAIKRIVFVKGPAESYVGHASPSAIAEALGKKYLWLEDAYVTAHIDVVDNVTQMTRTLLGRLDPQAAGFMLSRFLGKVQKYPPGNPEVQWIQFQNYSEHAEWLKSEDLVRLLGRNLDLSSVKRDPGVQPEVTAKTLIRHETPFVAVVDGTGRFEQLIDRNRALDQIVRREL